MKQCSFTFSLIFTCIEHHKMMFFQSFELNGVVSRCIGCWSLVSWYITKRADRSFVALVVLILIPFKIIEFGMFSESLWSIASSPWKAWIDLKAFDTPSSKKPEQIAREWQNRLWFNHLEILYKRSCSIRCIIAPKSMLQVHEVTHIKRINF